MVRYYRKRNRKQQHDHTISGAAAVDLRETVIGPLSTHASLSPSTTTATAAVAAATLQHTSTTLGVLNQQDAPSPLSAHSAVISKPFVATLRATSSSMASPSAAGVLTTTELVAGLREEYAMEVDETNSSICLVDSPSYRRQAKAARKATIEQRAHTVSSLDIAMARAEQQLARLREKRSQLMHAQHIDTAALRLDQIYRLLMSESVILTETHGDVHSQKLSGQYLLTHRFQDTVWFFPVPLHQFRHLSLETATIIETHAEVDPVKPCCWSCCKGYCTCCTCWVSHTERDIRV